MDLRTRCHKFNPFRVLSFCYFLVVLLYYFAPHRPWRRRRSQRATTAAWVPASAAARWAVPPALVVCVYRSTSSFLSTLSVFWGFRIVSNLLLVCIMMGVLFTPQPGECGRWRITLWGPFSPPACYEFQKRRSGCWLRPLAGPPWFTSIYTRVFLRCVCFFLCYLLSNTFFFKKKKKV